MYSRSAVLAICMMVVLGGAEAAAQTATPPKPANPELSRLLLDTNRARVTEVVLTPGAKLDLPQYPQRFAYLLTNARLYFARRGHAAYEMSFKAGEATLLPTEATDVQNGGSEQVRAVIVELKDAGQGSMRPKSKTKSKARQSVTIDVGKSKPSAR